jgi:tetratricopeptide (TPR) repeat protein
MYIKIFLLTLPFLSYILLASPAIADELPQSCIETTKTTSVNALKQLYLQCAKEVPEGGYRSLAYINLGTIFYREGNFSVAANYYDLASVGVGTVGSDPLFHAYRGSTYNKTGRGNEAVADADKVLVWLKSSDIKEDELHQELLEKIIPIYYENNKPDKLDAILSIYLNMREKYWLDYMNKSVMLSSINRYSEAYGYSSKALELESNHPAVLNNHCYILAQMGEPEKALPFCEKALKLLPNRAEIWDSVAFVKAKMGDCKGSETARLQALKFQPKVEDYKEPKLCQAR